MTEQTKASLSAAVTSTKHQAWKWIGALFMELKVDADGNEHLAASLTRVITLILFGGIMVYWWVKPTEVPQSMIQTLWGLLGLKGLYSITDAYRERGN